MDVLSVFLAIALNIEKRDRHLTQHRKAIAVIKNLKSDRSLFKDREKRSPYKNKEERSPLVRKR
jgi:hypothetical protein